MSISKYPEYPGVSQIIRAFEYLTTRLFQTLARYAVVLTV